MFLTFLIGSAFMSIIGSLFSWLGGVSDSGSSSASSGGSSLTRSMYTAASKTPAVSQKNLSKAGANVLMSSDLMGLTGQYASVKDIVNLFQVNRQLTAIYFGAIQNDSDTKKCKLVRVEKPEFWALIARRFPQLRNQTGLTQTALIGHLRSAFPYYSAKVLKTLGGKERLLMAPALKIDSESDYCQNEIEFDQGVRRFIDKSGQDLTAALQTTQTNLMLEEARQALQHSDLVVVLRDPNANSEMEKRQHMWLIVRVERRYSGKEEGGLCPESLAKRKGLPKSREMLLLIEATGSTVNGIFANFLSKPVGYLPEKGTGQMKNPSTMVCNPPQRIDQVRGLVMSGSNTSPAELWIERLMRNDSHEPAFFFPYYGGNEFNQISVWEVTNEANRNLTFHLASRGAGKASATATAATVVSSKTND